MCIACCVVTALQQFNSLLACMFPCIWCNRNTRKDISNWCWGGRSQSLWSVIQLHVLLSYLQTSWDFCTKNIYISAYLWDHEEVRMGSDDDKVQVAVFDVNVLLWRPWCYLFGTWTGAKDKIASSNLIYLYQYHWCVLQCCMYIWSCDS